MKGAQVILLAFCGLAFLFNAAAQTPVTFLPVLFVSPAPDRPAPDSAVMYAATICDGKLYDGNTAFAKVNIPNGWNPSLGVYAKLEVCSNEKCAKTYCSNWVSGRFNGFHYCSFTYIASMGDIYLRVTAGPSPNIDWTIAVEFLNTKSNVLQERQALRNDLDFPEPIAKKGVGADIQVLMQIVKTADVQTVKTLDSAEFSFRFCPDRETGKRYDITVAVIGTDSKSAMATYVCLPSEKPCTVSSSTHYDPRGIGINTVTLTTGSGQLSELHVLVVGWGDGKQTNSFFLGATYQKTVGFVD